MTQTEDYNYMELAKQSSSKSRCLKKQLGCVLVLSDGTVLEGYNGPPTMLPKCNPCPRLNSHSGTDKDLCRAVHAERLPLLTAAKRHVSTKRGILYSYMGVPCAQCLLELIESGVKEIVCLRETYYDELSKVILQQWVSRGGIFRVYNPYPCPEDNLHYNSDPNQIGGC